MTVAGRHAALRRVSRSRLHGPSRSVGRGRNAGEAAAGARVGACALRLGVDGAVRVSFHLRVSWVLFERVLHLAQGQVIVSYPIDGGIHCGGIWFRSQSHSTL